MLLLAIGLAALRLLASFPETKSFKGSEPISSNFELVIKHIASIPVVELADEEEALRKVCQARHFSSPDTPDHGLYPSRQNSDSPFGVNLHPFTPSLKIGVIFYTRRLRI
jgi:hypothetical protein